MFKYFLKITTEENREKNGVKQRFETASLITNTMTEFELIGDYIEMNKLLKLLGFVETGGEANSVITDGDVKLNGIVETQKRKKIRKGDKVSFKGSSISVI